MIKKIIFLLTTLLSTISFSQNFSEFWEGHFSYKNIKDISYSENKIYVAAENSVFSYDSFSNEIEEITTIKGLSGELITTIHYSETYELLIIGYENGLIEIVFDEDENILSVVDILEKATIQPTNKRINHFNEHNEVVYISTNFGISIFNLERLEFGDTYFIGNSGNQISVKQTTVYQDQIYAACLNNNGIKKGSLTNPNLVDYLEWQTIDTGNWIGIQTIGNSLFSINTDKNIYRISNDILNQLFNYIDIPVNIKNRDNRLIITTKSRIYIYDEDFNILNQIPNNINVDFTSSNIDSNYIYIGTASSGIYKVSLLEQAELEEIYIDGPLLNNHFSIEFENNNLWSVFGGYSVFFNWNGGIRQTGISNYIDEKWINTPYDSIRTFIDKPDFLSHISISPFDTNKVYISSYFSGLIEINNNEFINIYDENNSTITPFISEYCLTTVTSFDDNGALWVANGRVSTPLNKFENQTWQSYDFSSIIADPLNDDLGFRDLVIDNSTGTKWVASQSNGLIAFNETSGTSQLKNIFDETSGIPDKYITALALDRRNQLWIGTARGLRVLFNTSNFFEDDNPKASEIIILEDGIPQELLFEQFILDIEVDGSNNKWVATESSGVFYFSANGQQTIYHFTTENSPLPSNTVQDIALDESNGTVYIATNRGLVSFRSGSSSPIDDLESAYVYPNPVRPSFNIIDEKVKIKDISENVNIKITDIEGNLVAEAQSRKNLRHQGFNLEIDGGTAYWNGKNLANNVVASGVYLVMLSDLDTFETKVLKLMVVR